MASTNYAKPLTSRDAFRTSKYSSTAGANDYLYTKGKEYTTETGEEYIGEYHIIRSGQAFTGPTATTTSGISKRPLYSYYNNMDHFIYDRLFEYKPLAKQYVQPIPYFYTPRESEGVYDAGFDLRFFVQRHNADTYAIEIDGDQFDRVGREGGIDSAIYASVALQWRLTGTLQAIEELNKRNTNIASVQLPGLPYVILSYTQFARPTLQTVFNSEDSLFVRPAYKNNKVPIKQTFDRTTGRILPVD